MYAYQSLYLYLCTGMYLLRLSRGKKGYPALRLVDGVKCDV
jgi:hypothetical protein